MRPALSAGVVSLALVAAACSGAGSSTGARRPSTTAAPASTSTSTTAVASSTSSANANLPCGGPATVPDAVRASAVAALNVDPSQYRVVNVSVAQSDPAWARFDTLPASGQEGTYKGGPGLAHCSAAGWGITDFGTSEVGCPGGAISPPPEAVRSDLGIDCP